MTMTWSRSTEHVGGYAHDVVRADGYRIVHAWTGWQTYSPEGAKIGPRVGTLAEAKRIATQHAA